ncbi:hypothetical protein D3C87_1961870 [compost metagenome]
MQRGERIRTGGRAEHDRRRIARQQTHDEIDDEGNGKQRDNEADETPDEDG